MEDLTVSTILKYIETGISIDGNPKDGYSVFTIPTQHFKISSLEDLTPSKFEEMIKRQEEYEKSASEFIFLIKFR